MRLRYPAAYVPPDTTISAGCDLLVFEDGDEALPVGYEIKSRRGTGPIEFEWSRREEEACRRAMDAPRDPQLYGAYLWDRIARSLYDHPQATINRLLTITGATDTSNGLRTVLADQLLQVAIGLGGETRITVERALLSVLLVPAAASLERS